MKIDFEKSPDGLVPTVVQDAETQKVLMLGYMNRTAFEKTQKTEIVTFFSRSRQKLWTKGETSGNFLRVKKILIDCDDDTILIKANPSGAVCHTGAETCFSEKNEPENFLFALEKVIEERKQNRSKNSYTSQLFAKGINKIAQKVGEEAIELVIEAKDDDADLFKNEAADLLFHYLILLVAKNVTLEEVTVVLANRRKTAS